MKSRIGPPRLLGAALVFVIFTGVSHAANPTTRVTQGALSGTTDGGVSAFLGIRYAAPPIGPNRWRAPQVSASWKGIRNAGNFAPSCWQEILKGGFGPYTPEYLTQGEVSEDCLYLNVWTPAKAGARLPVLVWIHGGAFGVGSGSVPIYRGVALARNDVVVVTINYRLGVLGFFAHPDLTREAAGAPPANFGLQDQLAALRWVKDNIAAFGGDPGQITVAGQSAGAMSVHYLLASPLAKGLATRAIAQSGLPDSVPLASLADAERAGADFGQAKGAGSIAALRALSIRALTARGAGAFSLPVVDGVLIRQSPRDTRAAGWSLTVPLLTGFTADEDFDANPAKDAAAFRAKAESTYGPFADRIAVLYPADKPADAARALARDRVLADLYAWQRGRKEGPPVYAYLFTHVEPGPQSELWRSFHSSEIPYVFGTLDAAPSRGFTANDRQLSRTMNQYWVNFIRTGDPNGRELPKWPVFDSTSFDIMEFGDAVLARPILMAAKREIIDDYLDQGGGTGQFDASLRRSSASDKAVSAAVGNHKGLSGRWEFTVNNGGTTSAPTVVLVQQGDVLSGTYISRVLGEVPLKGTVKDGKFAFKVEHPALALEYAGTIQGNTVLEGSLTMNGSPTGTFKAERGK